MPIFTQAVRVSANRITIAVDVSSWRYGQSSNIRDPVNRDGGNVRAYLDISVQKGK